MYVCTDVLGLRRRQARVPECGKGKMALWSEHVLFIYTVEAAL
jgi:hypothetical protein